MSNKNKNKPATTATESIGVEETEQVSNQSSAIVSVSRRPMTISSGDVQFMSRGAQPIGNDQSLVTLQIKYPEDYGGPRYHKDGQVCHVSEETAQIFIDKGIAVRI